MAHNDIVINNVNNTPKILDRKIRYYKKKTIFYRKK